MISISGALMAVITLIGIALIFYIINWGVNRINPPEPYRKIIDVIIVLGVVASIVGVLLWFVWGIAIFKP